MNESTIKKQYTKLSKYIKDIKSYSGFITERNENGNQLHPDTALQENKINVIDHISGIEFDVPFYFEEENGKINLIVRLEKENLNLELFEIVSDIKNITFNQCKFNEDFYIKSNLTSLKLYNCIFEERCYINNQYEKNTAQIHLSNIDIKKTVFKKNFKLHNTLIDCFCILDTDFFKNADFFKSIFINGNKNKVLFNTINFHELALFEEAVFKKKLQFKYVTFKGYAHFRSTTFEYGLDLEYANIEEEMNFFDIKQLDTNQSIKSTSQETYRIVKHQLLKVGNIIESNKYHALELKKRQSTICKEHSSIQSFLDCIILLINNITSQYSRDWALAIMWIFIIGVATTYFLEKDIYNFNNIMQYISILNPFEAFKVNDKISYLVVMFNKISLGYLYYQVITSIRKDTKK